MDYNPEELIVKYLSNTLTSDQEAQLNNWLAIAKNKTQFDKLINKENLRRELADYNKIEKESEDVKVKARQLASVGAPILMMSRKSVFFKYMIAASVVAVVSVSVLAYLKFGSKNKTEVVAVKSQKERFKNDVLPANQSAVLELSDGRKISLDSLNNGILPIEGKITITKSNNGLLYKKETGEVYYNTLSTSIGKDYHLTLADGTEVWLDAMSSIHFPTAFPGSERIVEIKGQAYFEVAKNSRQPFKVKANDEVIEVLGTHFNINMHDALIKTTLFEGSVKVKSHIGNQVSESVIKPGQQAILDENRHMAINTSVDLDEIIAWKNGFFQFQDISIEKIMRQAQRWYAINVVYEGKINTAFNGKIPRNVPISKLLQILELTGEVKFKVEGQMITVIP